MIKTFSTPFFSGCISCLIDKSIQRAPSQIDDALREQYENRVRSVVQELAATQSGPEIAWQLQGIRERLFGPERSYAEEKRHFNAWMLDLLPSFRDSVRKAPDPLVRAIQLSATANYIDFGAVDNVNDDTLQMLFNRADTFAPDASVLASLRKELSKSRRLLYITDNCGEVVLDRLLCEILMENYPKLSISFLVRGQETVNDATLEDAMQTGLNTIGPVLSNGCGIAGTPLARISEDAIAALENADLIISKGQGNYETLQTAMLPIYFILLCKCALFTNRFHVPPFTPVLERAEFYPKSSLEVL